MLNVIFNMITVSFPGWKRKTGIQDIFRPPLPPGHNQKHL